MLNIAADTMQRIYQLIPPPVKVIFKFLENSLGSAVHGKDNSSLSSLGRLQAMKR